MKNKKTLQKPLFWPSRKATSLLKKATHLDGFIRIAPHFQPQLDPRTCGITSAAIVMHSLKPQPEPFSPWKVFEPPLTKRIKSKKTMLYSQNPGISLTELAQVIKANGFSVLKRQSGPLKTVDLFRQDIIRVLSSTKERLICNFDRSTIGLNYTGHFSPIGAYDRILDSVLVLDVATFCNSWFWIGCSKLFKAMQTRDKNGYRGYLIVKNKRDRKTNGG